MITVGSGFSGIGGFDLGFIRAGMEIAWQIEINDSCRTVLDRRLPGKLKGKDVRDVSGRELEPVQWMVGGFPCQDLSVAGKRAGLADERSGLFHEFMRLVAEVSPDGVVIENVPGLYSSWSGDTPSSLGISPGRGGRMVLEEECDFSIIVDKLVQLGYGVAWRCLDAQYFGLAQRRKRVFIIGCLGNARRAAEILFEPESVSWDSPPSREAGTRVAALTANGVGASGADDNQGQAGHLIPEVAGCLQERDAKGSDSDTKPGHLIVFDTTQITSDKNYSNPKAGDPSHPLAARAHPPAIVFAQNQRDELRDLKDLAGSIANEPGMKQQTFVAFTQNQVGDVLTGDIMHSLATNSNATGRSAPNVMNGMAVRRLMPVECERLQGFPDGWTEGHSDSAHYRMLGNAVAVPVAEWIGRRIIEADEKSLEDAA